MSTVDFQFVTFDGFSPVSTLGPYRASDYWKLPEGAPVELIRGEFMMSPAPRNSHQTIVVLLTELFSVISRKSGGITYCAPSDVVLSDDTILQPDLLYVSKARRSIVGDRVNGPPDLVIEVLSPGAERRDRVQKLDLYAKYGVAEFWVIDPRAQQIDFLLLNSDGYVITPSAAGRYQSPRLPEVEIDLDWFWREIAERLPQP
ncbi:MAG: Uma2 family endonuclease [Pirellulales bacterium]|nr:Uma2 family endonuclease [Pirellulales bacterium]